MHARLLRHGYAQAPTVNWLKMSAHQEIDTMSFSLTNEEKRLLACICYRRYT